MQQFMQEAIEEAKEDMREQFQILRSENNNAIDKKAVKAIVKKSMDKMKHKLEVDREELKTQHETMYGCINAVESTQKIHEVNEERFKYDPTVSSTVQASQLKVFI
ncbi:hypothetical protein RvY_06673 [Ramazzottius varieornatus]|uniref:Uncharacterized protein n=1 Tax=Ramazzottius varieornatus TaxID=947166 RepID=A0A1D1UZD4_RAMVA|nr:hypothetical protein RvY_06673 [Ramazzottius varieornatus]